MTCWVRGNAGLYRRSSHSRDAFGVSPSCVVPYPACGRNPPRWPSRYWPTSAPEKAAGRASCKKCRRRPGVATTHCIDHCITPASQFVENREKLVVYRLAQRAIRSSYRNPSATAEDPATRADFDRATVCTGSYRSHELEPALSAGRHPQSQALAPHERERYSSCRRAPFAHAVDVQISIIGRPIVKDDLDVFDIQPSDSRRQYGGTACSAISEEGRQFLILRNAPPSPAVPPANPSIKGHHFFRQSNHQKK